MMVRARLNFGAWQIVLPRLAAFLAALLYACILAASGAQAQTTTTYTITPGTAINDNSCTDSTINVPTSYTVADVNIGIALTHTWRNDLQISLIAPGGGTTVALMTNTGGNGDNVHDLFDDSEATVITSHDGAATDSTSTPPPYSHNYRPAGTLSSFNGLNASGNWTVRVCDTANADTGTFTRADLYITSPPTNYVDLSLTNTVSSATPAYFDLITYTVSVTNSATATQDATGVVVRDLLPAGLSFVSMSGDGSYNSGTGDWTVGSVPINTTRTMVITAQVTASAGTSIANVAEVTAQGQTDLDSTPNNGATGEDDYRSVSLTVSATRLAGTPPTLTCPAGSSQLDWDSTTWTAGSTSGSSTVSGIGSVSIAVTTPSGATWFNNASFGGQNPAKATQLTGGLATGQSLHQYIDFANRTQTADTTFTLPTKITGAQFRIYDVDFNSGQFADKVTVTGYNGATAVTPTVTNGVVNYVSANVAIGDGGSADTSSDGNIVITFTSAIDSIVVAYGNHTTAPANPGGQAVALADMTFCRPYADLSLVKTVSNASPAPGASVNFVLTATSASASTATASGITASDVLPAGFTYVSDTSGGTYNSGTGVWTIGSLAPGASAAITITGTASGSAGTTVTNTAQITASSLPDSDSTVNNGVTSEDDYATVSYTITAALTPLVCPGGGSPNQLVANGSFASGTGPSWTSWTAAAIWTGTGAADVNSDTTSGAITQSGFTGLKYGPDSGGGAVIQLTQWWRNGAPAASSTSATLTVSLAGTDIARITSPAGATATASVAYLNGASGNITSITEFNNTPWRINAPTSVAASGALSFTHTPSGTTPSDDYRIDDVTLYTCPPALLGLAKSSASWNDGVNPVFDLPGNDVTYTLRVTNTGQGQTSSDSVIVIDTLPANVTFFNGDADGGGAETNPVYFVDASSGLTFSYATDVRYSDAASLPASFAACSYTPAAGYDAAVRYVCINPKGVMTRSTGAPDPAFEVKFRARIN